MAIQNLCSVDDCGKPIKTRGWCCRHYRRWQRHGDPLAGRRTPNGEPHAWIERHVAYQGAECLIWPFSRNPAGYGLTDVDGSTVNASRFMCEKAHGPAPAPKLDAAHSCGNGRGGCVAPNHLSWKTEVENAADKIAHGTHLRGAKQNGAKLTEGDVLEIRRRLKFQAQYELAALFGVTQSLISAIHLRKKWAWLP